MQQIRKLPLLLATLHCINAQTEPECKPFNEIYASGKELCENMWDEAFSYTENAPDQSYTMWFFSDSNPNDQVTLNLGLNTTSQCLLDYYHRDVTAEADNFTECHPWKEAACCYQDTVKDVDTIINAYGPEYRYDRCGPLSQACERFFVQEACFYECDPNVGLYRYQGNHSWRIYQMPIQAEYCDAWFRACYNDLFCASDGGSYFSCALEYKAVDEAANEGDNTVDIILVVVIVIIVLIVIAMFVFICYVRNRERKGNPYFASFEPAANSPSSPNQSQGDTELQGTR